MRFFFKKSIRFLCALSLVLCTYLEASTSQTPTYIITGASGELGGAIAKNLAIKGHLILIGRNKEKLLSLKKTIQNTSAEYEHEVFCVDFSSLDSIVSFQHFLEQHHQKIDGLVLIPPRVTFHGKGILQEQTIWLQTLQETFTGPLEFLKTTLPFLNNKSRIVVIAGTTSVQYQPSVGGSCVVKKMWTTAVKALSYELSPQEITINSLSPGVVLTEFHKKRIMDQAQRHHVSFEEELTQDSITIPLKRHAQTQEIADSVLFLIEPKASFINGANIVIDGGYTTAY